MNAPTSYSISKCQLDTKHARPPHDCPAWSSVAVSVEITHTKWLEYFLNHKGNISTDSLFPNSLGCYQT